MRNTRYADQRARIRALFLQPAESYRLNDAARILGVTRGVLTRDAKADDEEAYRENGRWRFTWRQVVYRALQQWSLAEIHAALGADARTALPALLNLRAVTVRLPEFIVRAIEVSAANEHMTIDDWLHHELVDFAGTAVDRMERLIPGFRRAYLYPGDAIRSGRKTSRIA
jgi:hypothetical protein